MKRALAVAVVLVLAAGIGMVVKNMSANLASDTAGVMPGLGPQSGPESGFRKSADGVSLEDSRQFGEAVGGVDAGAALELPATTADDGLAVLPQPAGAGPRVIKNASITVRLDDGDFESSFQEASLVASRRGGFIASSSTSRGDEFRSGTLVIRVPANVFDETLADLRELGDVIGEEASGEDVTATFVDLQARLRNWEAQESVLLRLMSQATTIDESIKVQRNLSDVQLEIERLRGQIRLLRDQTDMGTISLTLAEGDAIAEVTKEKERGTLAKAWHDAIDGFLGVIAATVVGLGYLIPIGLLLMLGMLLFRRLRPAVVVPES